MYEYKVITSYSFTRNKLVSKLETELNTLASEGWRLATHMIGPEGASYLIMEREMTNNYKDNYDNNEF